MSVDGAAGGPAGDLDTVASAYDASSVPMCGLSWPEFRFVTANAAYRAFSGRDDLIGRHGREVFPEFEGQQIFEMLERACTTGERRVLREWRIQLETGSGTAEDYYLDLVVDPVPGPSGETERLQVIVLDVTEQTRARLLVEAEATATRRRLTTALDVVDALQSALLPDGLPVLPMVDTAASYRLADEALAAGGDWFDVLPLDDGRVGLVVGDVVGHGVRASAVMGQLRSALGSALSSGMAPADAVRFVDRYADRLPGARSATVVAAVLDPVTGDLDYCTAGHVPPLVLTDAGEGRYLEPTGGGPLATASAHVSREHWLAAGDTVMLFSDGLVERPGRPPAESMVEILQVAADAVRGRGPMTGASSSAAERVAQWSVELLTRATGTTDDVTVLAAQRRPAPIPTLRLEMAARPEAVRTVRADLHDWCETLALDQATQLVVDHSVHELVANVVEHAFGDDIDGPPALALEASVSSLGVLHLCVTDNGRWRDDAGPPPVQPSDPAFAARRGRGLALVTELLDDVEVSSGETGTVVRASYRLTRAVSHETTTPPTGVSSAAGFVVELREDGVVTVAGAVDMLSAEELRRVLQTATHGGSTGVTVDLSEVTLLGSNAIAVLLQPWMRSSRLYAPMGSTAQHVLDLVGVDYESTLG